MANRFYSTPKQSQKAGDGTLAESENITIICTTCYMMGEATAQLTVNGNFNATQAFDSVLNDTKADFDNITSAVVNYIENAWDDIGDVNDFQPPTMSNVSFDLDIQGIPETILQLQFDGLELYVELDTVLTLGATYTVNLFTPATPLALTVPGMDVGVWFVLDLILDAEAEIDMSSGFHIKLDDGVQINLAMFANNASDITL